MKNDTTRYAKDADTSDFKGAQSQINGEFLSLGVLT